MKRHFHPIAIAILAVLMCVQAASAQEGKRGARFSYAPNVWKTEQATVPRSWQADAPVNVRQGAVPSSGNSLLGLDPNLLRKPEPAPIYRPQQSVAARPISQQVTPHMVPKVAYQPQFGTPNHIAPLAQQAARPTMASALPATPAVARAMPSHVRHGGGRRHVTTGLSGRLRPPRRVAPETATPQVASYGNNVGYIPGNTLPASSTAGLGARTAVKGRLMRTH